MNCLVIDDDRFCSKIIADYVSKTPWLNLLGECKNPIEAMEAMSKNKVDLLFLDIEMPLMSGMDFIKSMDSLPHIILITSHTNFAIEAFELNVSDYLVKPTSYARFLKAVNKLKKDQTSVDENKERDFFVKSDGALVKIVVDELCWIEAKENYMLFQTTTDRHIVHITLKEVESKLPSKEFLRIHRSFIVRLDKIDSVAPDSVTVKGKELPVSRSYKSELNDRIKLF